MGEWTEGLLPAEPCLFLARQVCLRGWLGLNGYLALQAVSSPSLVLFTRGLCWFHEARVFILNPFAARTPNP